MGLVAGLLGIKTGPDLPPAALAQIQAGNAATRSSGQTSVGAIDAQQQLLQALQAQRGIQNQSDVYGQLQGVASGTGPNPAEALLHNATGANVASTASLMAGARGATANPGLIARQAAQQGAGIQQNAVGQAAALQAQQQLGAIGAAGNIANMQVGNQVGATAALNQFAQNREAMQQQALANYNQSQVASQGSVNVANAGIQQQEMKSQSDITGGLLSGLGSALGLVGGGSKKAEGGEIDPSEVAPMEAAPELMSDVAGHADEAAAPMSGPLSATGKFLKGLMTSSTATPVDDSGRLLQALGGETNVGAKLKEGGKVPGKPKVAGAKDSYSNDTVNAKLSPGEIVLPRSVTQSSDPVAASMRFVQAVLEKKKREGRS